MPRTNNSNLIYSKNRRSLYLPSSKGLEKAWAQYNDETDGKTDWANLCVQAVDDALAAIEDKRIQSISSLFKFLCAKRREIAKTLKHHDDILPEEINAAKEVGIRFGDYGVIRHEGLVTYMHEKNRYAAQIELFENRIMEFVRKHEQNNLEGVKVEDFSEPENNFKMYEITFIGNKIINIDCYSRIFGHLKAGDQCTQSYSTITMVKQDDKIIEMKIDHANHYAFDEVFSYLDKLGKPLFSSELKDNQEECKKILAEIQWVLSQVAFCELGSASTNILLDRTMSLFLKLPLLDYKHGTPLDLEAISMSCSEFIASFNSMYQENSIPVQQITTQNYKPEFFQSESICHGPTTVNSIEMEEWNTAILGNSHLLYQ